MRVVITLAVACLVGALGCGSGGGETGTSGGDWSDGGRWKLAGSGSCAGLPTYSPRWSEILGGTMDVTATPGAASSTEFSGTWQQTVERYHLENGTAVSDGTTTESGTVTGTMGATDLSMEMTGTRTYRVSGSLMGAEWLLVGSGANAGVSCTVSIRISR